jgi:hypothetical protein
MQGMTQSVTTDNYIITFNAATKTVSPSGSTTVSISGENINTLWPVLRENLENLYDEQDGVTVTFNDAKHSYTITYNNFTQTLTDQLLSSLGYQINQNRSKIKMAGEGMEIIFTKQ